MSSQKKSSRLEGKDLITIGIYTVIYVVIVMLVAMLGFIPIFIPLMAVLCPLIGGIPYMLYVTKAKKFGMTAIMGFLIGLIMVFFGNGYLTMVTGLVGGLLADVILKKADYKSAKSTVLSCGVFSIWVFGNFAPIFLNRESYMVMLTEGYGAEYAATLNTYMPTLVRREFKPFLTDEDEKKIRDKFKNTETIPDDDINTSVDQTKRLIMAIKNNDLRYPEVKDGYFRHDVVLEFLKKLSNVFQWKIYESSTLGKDSLLSWYAVILCEWMEGNGLNYIMRAALKHHREKPDDFWINRYTKGVYDDTSLIHRNIVFADTLEVIENVILFSISNYFLRFSNEFRRIKGDDELDANNWYEYVEYGTTNPLTILLQRNGFSRESARFIKENPEYVVKDGSTGKLKLKASLSKCGRTSVENEVEYIRQNVPGIFVGEEE